MFATSRLTRKSLTNISCTKFKLPTKRSYTIPTLSPPPQNIPGLSGQEGFSEWINIGGLTCRLNAHKQLRKKYGDIVRVDIPGFNFVAIYHPDDVKLVFSKEGKYPIGVAQIFAANLEPIDKELGFKPSLGTSTGPDWKEMRNLVQKDISPPPVAQSYLSLVAPSAHKLVENLPELQNIPESFSIISIEMFHVIAFGKSTGIFDGPWEENQWCQFIRRGLVAFKANMDMQRGMPEQRKAATERYKSEVQFLHSVVSKATHEAIKESDQWSKLQAKPYIARMFERGEAGIKEILEGQTILSVFFAALDTTANSISWLMIFLAKYPETQEKLFKEFSTVCKGELLKEEHLKHIPYMRACIKEAFRVIGGTNNMRILDSEVTLQGQKLPPNTLIEICTTPYCHDEAVFPDAQTFNPDRWLSTSSDGLQNHPYLILPFGVGARMCLGSRVAEVEMMAFFSQLVQTYTFKCTNEPYNVSALEGFPKPVPKPLFEFTRRK